MTLVDGNGVTYKITGDKFYSGCGLDVIVE